MRVDGIITSSFQLSRSEAPRSLAGGSWLTSLRQGGREKPDWQGDTAGRDPHGTDTLVWQRNTKAAS